MVIISRCSSSSRSSSSRRSSSRSSSSSCCRRRRRCCCRRRRHHYHHNLFRVSREQSEIIQIIIITLRLEGSRGTGEQRAPTNHLISTSRFPAMAISKVVFFAAAALLACTLHGCGCSTEKMAECTTKYTAAATTDKCNPFSVYTTCMKDASCCDTTVDSVPTKPLITTMEAGSKLIGCAKPVNSCV
jgi:hypothetical protein